ncbi:uncharacterized protein ATNIH1004_004609 [Aspergillus tanneri]|uniref:Uncharacterized protein n=1 Tax=Aspergillus tanneri TaxID=1220188 RepID=A0A5M9MTM3_9EURO|nr:uncharacterized protein ATNIH1004_004609 [Aspergillus tanneri]KAA8648724.1 hypothetical protein ATNIH1004_004609 [Aspergillus tanneri]
MSKESRDLSASAERSVKKDNVPQNVSLSRDMCPLEAARFLADLSECLNGIRLHPVNFNDRLLALQPPNQSTSFTSPSTDKEQTASANWNIVEMGANANSPDHKDHHKSAPEECKARSDAVTLLRSRTLTRLSPTESSCPVNSSTQPQSQDPKLDDQQSATFINSPVVMMEPVLASKKGKKKKKSKKFRKLDLTQIEHELSPEDDTKPSPEAITPPGEQIPTNHPQNKRDGFCGTSPFLAKYQSTLGLVPSSKLEDTKTKDCSSANGAGPQSNDPNVADQGINKKTHEEPANELSLAASHKQGKRRVARVDPVTGDEISEAIQHPHPCLPTNEEKSLPSSHPVLDQRGVEGISPGSGKTEICSDTEPAMTSPSTQPSRTGQSTRRSTIPMREKLSPIQETSDAKAEGGISAAEAQRVLATTPKTEKSDADSNDTKHRHRKNSNKSPAATASQGKVNHTHPASPSGSEQSTLAAPSSRGSVSTQKPEGFFWQLDSHGLPCAKSGCEKRCNFWDGETVICPRCGPYSETRYCCKEHLFEDIKWHWLYCGQVTFEHPCRESSIPRTVRSGPPLVPCLHPYDTPERHRQAVHFSANARRGDYFIFSDWADFVEAGFPENNASVRCSHKIVYVVRFDDPDEKDRFRRVLAACLFMTIDVHELVDYLFRLIRDKLRSQAAPADMETALKHQFQAEYCVTIQPAITGERHACDTDWNGKNRRNCPDAACRAEYRRLLGSPGGRGHGHLVDHLEGTYWTLRAARTTHPSITSVTARMQGEGFDQVADEDQRVFRRGEGWDGAGTGDMEIEGINA